MKCPGMAQKLQNLKEYSNWIGNNAAEHMTGGYRSYGRQVKHNGNSNAAAPG